MKIRKVLGPLSMFCHQFIVRIFVCFVLFFSHQKRVTRKPFSKMPLIISSNWLLLCFASLVVIELLLLLYCGFLSCFVVWQGNRQKVLLMPVGCFFQLEPLLPGLVMMMTMNIFLAFPNNHHGALSYSIFTIFISNHCLLPTYHALLLQSLSLGSW